MFSGLYLSFGLSVPVGFPTGITFSGMMSCGVLRAFLETSILSLYGYAAVQTAPNPKASAANNIFSLAQVLSITANSIRLSCAFSGIAQTIIAAPALSNILAYGNPAARVSRVFRSVTTTNAHGCLFTAVGAAIPALMILYSASLLTLCPVKLRTLLRL